MFADSNRTLLIASLATLATFLDTTILYVAFPDIAATFTDTSAAELSWVLNAYTIVFAALLIPAGKIAGIASATAASSHRIGTLHGLVDGVRSCADRRVADRVSHDPGRWSSRPDPGVAGAGDARLRPRPTATSGGHLECSGRRGRRARPTLGAAIVETLGWRWAFFINLPIGLYTIVAGRSELHESSNPDTRIPAFLGVVLVATAAGLMSYAVVSTEEAGWLSARTLGLFLAGGLAVAAFIVHQRRTPAPVLDLELFEINNFRWANLAMLVFGTAFSALFLGSILFLTQVWGWSILQAGFGVAPGPVIVGLVAPRIGSLAGRIGQRPILLIGGVLYASSGAYRLVILDPGFRLPPRLPPVHGAQRDRRRVRVPQLSSVVAQALPPNRRGVGGAALQAGRQFGGTFGVALTIAFLGAATGIPAAMSAFDQIWWLIVIGGLATSALVLPLLTNDTTVGADIAHDRASPPDRIRPASQSDELAASTD